MNLSIRKLIALFIALTMLLGVIPMSAVAEGVRNAWTVNSGSAANNGKTPAAENNGGKEGGGTRTLHQYQQLINEGFENNETSLPEGWSLTPYNSYAWNIGNGTGYGSNNSSHSGSYYAYASFNNRDYGWTYLCMPAVDLSDAFIARMSFWYKNPAWGGDIDQINVSYKCGESGEWTDINVITDAHDTWTSVVLTIPTEAHTDNVYLRFGAYSNYGYGVGIDDVLVEKIENYEHEHSWSYAWDDETGTATAVCEDCYIDAPTLTVTASDKSVDGEAYAPSIVMSDSWTTDNGIASPVIKYYSDEGCTTEIDAPSEVGVYWLRAYLGEEYITRSFKILSTFLIPTTGEEEIDISGFAVGAEFLIFDHNKNANYGDNWDGTLKIKLASGTGINITGSVHTEDIDKLYISGSESVGDPLSYSGTCSVATSISDQYAILRFVSDISVNYSGIELRAKILPAKSITYSTADNGAVTGPAYGLAGNQVTVSATPAEGCLCSGVTVNDSAEGVTDNEDGTWSFVMPNENVTVKASFGEIVTVSFVDPDDGNVLCSVDIPKGSKARFPDYFSKFKNDKWYYTSGWKLGSQWFNWNSTVNEDTELTAYWALGFAESFIEEAVPDPSDGNVLPNGWQDSGLSYETKWEFGYDGEHSKQKGNYAYNVTSDTYYKAGLYSPVISVGYFDAIGISFRYLNPASTNEEGEIVMVPFKVYYKVYDSDEMGLDPIGSDWIVLFTADSCHDAWTQFDTVLLKENILEAADKEDVHSIKLYFEGQVSTNDDWPDAFTAVDDVLIVSADSGAHHHEWDYEADGSVITASCTAEGCELDDQTLTISAEGKTYDGTPVSANIELSDGWSEANSFDTVDEDNIVYYQYVDGDWSLIDTAPVNVGSYKAAYTVGDATAEVEFSISAKDVTVKANDASKTYGDDDPALTAEITGLVEDDTVGYTLTRAEGEDVDTYTITASGESEQGNYNVSFIGGVFTVNPKAVTVTAVSTGKTYGTSDPTLTATVDGVVDEDEIAYAVTREGGEDVGEYTITVSGEAEQGNYTVSYVGGTFTISAVGEVTVYITGNNDNVDYNGTEHTVSGYTFNATDTNYTASCFSFFGTAAASRTNAGTTQMGLNANQFANTSSNFTTVTFVIANDGYITVNPIDVTVNITGSNVSAAYDGEEHMAQGYTAEFSTDLYNADCFTFSGTGEATRTNVGTTNMGLAASQFTNISDNFENVTFNVTDGYVTITALDVAVTIIGNADSLEYAACEQSITGYTVTNISNELFTSDLITFTGEAKAKGTNVGTYYMGLTADKFGSSSNNFNVTFTVASDGALAITQKTATVKANDASKTYGDEDPEFSATVTGVYSSDTISYQVVCEHEENAGSYTISVSPSTSQNYNILTESGTFTIDPKGVTVKANDNSKTYGDDDPGLTATVSGTLNDDTVAYTLTRAEGEDVKDYTITADGDTEQGNYTVTFENGTFTINRKAVTVTADNKSKAFGGTDPELTATVQGLVGSDTLEYEIYREGGDEVGTYPIKFTGETVQGNYTVSFVEGVFTISAIDEVVVYITGHYYSGTYDGDEHSASGYDIEISNPLFTENDIVFSGTEAEAVRTDAGTTYMGLTSDMFSNSNSNFTNVTFNVTDGYVALSPLEVTVTIVGTADTLTYAGCELSIEGYTVTGISNELFTEDYIVFDGLAVASGTNVDTYYMGLQAEQFSTCEDNNFDVTFEITDGALSIIRKEVTVSANDSSKTYGEDDPDFEATVSGTFNGDTVEYSISREPGDDAGTYTLNVTGEETQGNYTVTYAAGTFTINSKQVTVSAADKEKVYGEDDPELTYNIEGVVEGDTLELECSIDRAEGENIGEYDIIVEGPEALGNYTLVYENGVFTITPYTNEIVVTVTGQNYTGPYDGEEHSVLGYDTSFSSSLFTAEDFEFIGETTPSAARTNAGTTDMGITDEMFVLCTDNFTNVKFNVVDGFVTITPINVTVIITGHNTSVDYDGEQHTVTGYNVEIEDSLYTEDDFTFSGTAEASRTEVGTTQMGLAASDFANTNENFSEVIFAVTDGYITVGNNETEIIVTIVGHNETVDYDGEEHTVTGYDIEISGSDLYTANDFSLTATASASAAITDAGTAYMGLTADSFTNNNTSFTNVTFVVTDGFVKVDPITASVSISGYYDNADYDGSQHSVTGYELEIEGDLYTAADFIFTGTARADRTDAGTTYMGLTADMFVNTNTNFSEVTFNVTDGYMTVNPISVTVTITGNHDTVDYNGEEHTVTGYEAAFSDPLYTEDDFSFTGSAEAARTDVGTTYMGLAAEMFENANDNFTDVVFNVDDGYITVSPISVTVTVIGAATAVTYNGSQQTLTGYTVTAISLPELYSADDFTFTGTASASGTDAGTYYMGLTADKFENTNTNFANVIFSVQDGALTIEQKDVTASAQDASKIYGEDDPELTAVFEGLIGDDTVSYEVSRVEGEDVGTYAISVSVGDSRNYSITCVGAVFTVEPKEVTVKADDLYKTYGEDDPELTATVSGNLYGDIISYYIERESGDTAGDYTVYVTGNAKQGNYTVAFETGTFTVYKKEITVSADDKTMVYGGTEPELTATVDGLVEGDSIEYTLSREEGDDVGEYTIYVEGPEATDNYTVSYEEGTLTITPATSVVVTITGNHDTVDYDGEDHGVTGYTFSANIAGYTANDFSFTGAAAPYASRTDAGTTNMGLVSSMFTNNNENFENVTFNVVDGYITVTPIDVTVTVNASTDTADYDGEEHEVEGFEIVPDNELYTLDDISFYGEAYAARTDAGTTYMGLTAEMFENTNQNFATVTFIVNDGYITVSPIGVTVNITGNHDAVDYNGEEHTVSGYAVEISDPLYTEDDFTFTGSAEAARTDVGTGYMGLTADMFTNTNENFSEVNFVIADGYIMVMPIDVVVTIIGGAQTYTYAGCQQSVTGYVASFSNTLYTNNDFTFSGTAAASGTDVGTYTMGLSAEQFTNTNQNFGTVTFVVQADGALTIDPKAVTVTADDVSKSYGEDDPELTYEVNGVIGEDEIEFTISRESGEAIGTYDITFDGETEQGNYTVTFTGGTFTIVPASIDEPYVAFVDGAQYYDGTEKTPGVEVYFGTTPIPETEYTVEYSDNIDAGWATVTITNVEGNYVVNCTEQFLIWPKDITVTADEVTKQYGDEDPELTYTVSEELIDGNSFTGSLCRVNGEEPGSYEIQLNNLSAGSNYRIHFESADFIITNRTVTVTAVDSDKTYGEDDPELTATVEGLLGEDTIEYTVTREEGEDVGTYDIILSGEATQGVYDIEFVDGVFTINPKEITLTADDNEKTYGEDDPELTATVEGLEEGDELNYEVIREEGEDVGEYIISIELGDNPNYDITTSDGIFTINPKEITLFADDNEKTYGEDDPELTATVEGLEEGDELNYEVIREEGEDVGEYTISIELGDNPNYDITTSDGIFTINSKEITLTADDNEKTYGEDDPELTATVEGLEEGDELNYEVIREEGEDVGEYTISIELGDNPNYDITTSDGIFTINPKAITLSADDNEKTYGEDDPELTATVEGLEEGDELNYEVIREEGEDVGEYTISIELGDNPNYDITTSDGIFTINPKEITLTADDNEKTYGEDDPELTATVEGLEEGDELDYEVIREEGEDVGEYTISIELGDNPNYDITTEDGIFTINAKAITLTADDNEKTYGEDDPELTATVEGLEEGDELDYEIVREEGEDVGTYVIYIEGDTEQGNYVVTFVNGTFTINTKVIENAVIALHGGPYTYNGSAVTPVVIVYDGEEFINVSEYTVTYSNNVSAGTATVTITDNDGGNYTVSGSTTFLIWRKDITVDADEITKFYGQDDPELTYTVEGLIGNDGLTGSLTREPGEEIGTYRIMQGSLDAGNNYTIIFTGAEFTIDFAPVTVTAANMSKVYGDEEPELEYTVTGLIEGEDIEFSILREEGEDAGEYVISFEGERMQGNYSITYVNGVFTIERKTVTVTASDAGKTYGEDDPELTDTVEGLIDDDTIEYEIVREEGENAGTYSIYFIGDEIQGNYAVTYVNGVFTIAPIIIDQTNIEIATSGGVLYYDGTEKTPRVFVFCQDELISMAEYTVVYSNNINAGTAVITIVDNEGGNYTVSGRSTFIIWPKTVTVTVGEYSKHYGEEDPEFTASAAGLVEGDSIDFTITREEGEETGTYAITPTGWNYQGNYIVNYVNGSLEIWRDDPVSWYERAELRSHNNDDGKVDIRYIFAVELRETKIMYINEYYNGTADDGKFEIVSLAVVFTRSDLDNIRRYTVNCSNIYAMYADAESPYFEFTALLTNVDDEMAEFVFSACSKVGFTREGEQIRYIYSEPTEPCALGEMISDINNND